MNETLVEWYVMATSEAVLLFIREINGEATE